MDIPLISIIITTKNEEQNIEACLISIEEQSYSRLETIVVDNASTDKTKEISKKFTDKVYEKGPERSAQRNFGMIEVAQGGYVMFVDSDMILAPELIEKCFEFISSEDYVALHIPEIVLGKGYWSRVRRFERKFYEGTVIDAARFFKKDAFVKIGGFDELLSGPEDWDIDKKIKQIGKIGLLPMTLRSEYRHWKQMGIIAEKGVDPRRLGNVIFHDESRLILKNYLSKKSYYTESLDKYVTRWGRDDPDIRKQLGVWYRFFAVFWGNGKWKKILANPHLSVGVYLLRFMVGLIYIFRVKVRKVC